MRAILAALALAFTLAGADRGTVSAGAATTEEGFEGQPADLDSQYDPHRFVDAVVPALGTRYGMFGAGTLSDGRPAMVVLVYQPTPADNALIRAAWVAAAGENAAEIGDQVLVQAAPRRKAELDAYRDAVEAVLTPVPLDRAPTRFGTALDIPAGQVVLTVSHDVDPALLAAAQAALPAEAQRLEWDDHPATGNESRFAPPLRIGKGITMGSPTGGTCTEGFKFWRQPAHTEVIGSTAGHCSYPTVTGQNVYIGGTNMGPVYANDLRDNGVGVDALVHALYNVEAYSNIYRSDSVRLPVKSEWPVLLLRPSVYAPFAAAGTRVCYVGRSNVQSCGNISGALNRTEYVSAGAGGPVAGRALHLWCVNNLSTSTVPQAGDSGGPWYRWTAMEAADGTPYQAAAAVGHHSGRIGGEACFTPVYYVRGRYGALLALDPGTGV